MDSLPSPQKMYKSKHEEDQIIQNALEIINKRLFAKDKLASPREVEIYLSLKLGQKSNEVFCCIYLDNKNQIIAFEELFKGTINHVSVYPRIVVKRCIEIECFSFDSGT